MLKVVESHVDKTECRNILGSILREMESSVTEIDNELSHYL